MIPKKFPEATTLLQSAGCDDVPCCLVKYRDGGQAVLTLWHPSLRERFSIFFFGKVWLAVWGSHKQPPVALVCSRNHGSDIPHA